MPLNVFGNYSEKSENRIDPSLFVQKHYMRTNFTESSIEEDKDQKIISKLRIYLVP